MTNNILIECIHNGESLVSTMLSRMRNLVWAKILAELPFDFMAIDNELIETLVLKGSDLTASGTKNNRRGK